MTCFLNDHMNGKIVLSAVRVPIDLNNFDNKEFTSWSELVRTQKLNGNYIDDWAV